MLKLSTAQVARKVGISPPTLGRHIKTGKVPAPPETMAGGIRLRLWSEGDVERLREALPKAKNGRKSRYLKLREKQKAQAKKLVPRKSKKKK
jgi:predicted DNA-binding transcriptional regulator AlpA